MLLGEGAAAPRQLPEVLTGVAVVLLALLVVRLVLVGLLVLVARVGPAVGSRRTARWAVRLSPRSLRPVVVLCLGAALGIGTATAAGAAPHPAASARHLPDAGWTGAAARPPERPSAALPSAPSLPSLPPAGWVASAPNRGPAAPDLVTSDGRRHVEADRADDVVVRRGDTLWSLAARQLGPGATDAQVAAQWPRWWHANRDRVGADPDRLLPGTRLVAPGGAPR
ncbi:hypothetical protein GCM10027446_14560 [Angustibacter peucedani]